MTVAVSPGVGISADELLLHDRWSRDRLLAHQRERLLELLEQTVSASPYYREVLGRDAFAEDVRLDQLPTLSKETLMDEFDRVAADPRLRLAAVEAHMGSDDPAALLAGDFHVFSTSGTTGRRGVFPQTVGELDRWLAAAWRVRRRLGIGAGIRVVGIGAPTPLHITQKLFTAFGGFGGGRPRLTVTAPLPELVEALNDDRPEAIFMAPSIAGLLAEEQLEGRLSIAPRWIVSAGEVLAGDVARRTAEAWGIEPLQVYASTEALIIASEPPERGCLDVCEDLVILEVVDECNRPVAPGVPGFKVLLTSLVNRALPLIRYELADTVTLAPGPHPEGRPYLRIERVDGRNDDVLRLPTVAGGEALVLPYRLRAAFTQLPDVIQYQLVHEPRRLAVLVVLRAASPPGTVDRVAAGIRSAIEEAGGVPPPIEVEPVPAIEPEPGAAKLKVVKTVSAAPA